MDTAPASLGLDLLGDAEPLRAARRFVRVQAEQLGREEQGDDAVQVTAELLGDLGTGTRPVAVRVSEVDGALQVGVDVRFVGDDGHGADRPAVSARTRDLLTHLSTAWGWRPVDGGAHVWCRLPGPPAR
ncbi:ATP-binding protein [Kineococcus aurantiacus]|uniref:ATP-binding protein n=1 Tax=Kineococcus aurantiacus TaxID=37633 RepID=A0A7Y9DN78_9ACTN|nr:hypothetical protein [Kineococcus aurantiacus]NYD23725.1 hypothetical protein [Kineococcus aurantiacus]